MKLFYSLISSQTSKELPFFNRFLISAVRLRVIEYWATWCNEFIKGRLLPCVCSQIYKHLASGAILKAIKSEQIFVGAVFIFPFSITSGINGRKARTRGRRFVVRVSEVVCKADSLYVLSS